MNNNDRRYDDIIDMEHHVSQTHKQMSVHDRAAQFAPFAALTGHDEAIREESRITYQRKELDENMMEILDRKLDYIIKKKNTDFDIKLTYFVPDDTKSGGKYITIDGRIDKIDRYNRIIKMKDGRDIKICEIIDIEY